MTTTVAITLRKQAERSLSFQQLMSVHIFAKQNLVNKEFY